MRSGEAHVRRDGAWVRVVLEKPGPGEIHMRELADGTALQLRDGLVVKVEKARLFGKKGRRYDVVATVQEAPSSEWAGAYLNRVLRDGGDVEALAYAIRRGVVFEGCVTFMKRHPEAVNELLERALRAEDHTERSSRVMRILTMHATSPTLLWEVSDIPMTRAVGLRRLGELGHTDAVKQFSAVALRECKENPDLLYDTCVTLEAAVAALGEDGPADLSALVQETWGADEDAEGLETLLEAAKGAPAPWALFATHRSARPSVGDYVERVEAVEELAEAWEEVCALVGVTVGAVRHRAGRAEVLSRVEEGAEVLRRFVSDDDIAVRRVALVRLGDDEAWAEALSGERGAYFAEKAPKEILERHGVAPESPSALQIVALSRGVLSERDAAASRSSRVRAHVARVSDDHTLLEVLAQDPDVFVAGIAASRLRDADLAGRLALEFSGRGAERGETWQLTVRVAEERERELRLGQIAREAMVRGEVVVARGALSQITDADVLWDLSGVAGLEEAVWTRLTALRTPPPF